MLPAPILADFPPEILDAVVVFLTPRNLAHCALVSKSWSLIFTPYLYSNIHIVFDVYLRHFHTVETHVALKRHAHHVRSIKTRFFSVLAPFLGLRLDNLIKIEFPWECKFKDPPPPVPMFRPSKSAIRRMRAAYKAQQQMVASGASATSTTTTFGGGFGGGFGGRFGGGFGGFGGEPAPSADNGEQDSSDDSEDASTPPSPPPLDPYSAQIPLERYLISILQQAPGLRVLSLKGVQFSKPDLIRALVDGPKSCLEIMTLESGESEVAEASTIRYMLERLPATVRELFFRVDLNPTPATAHGKAIDNGDNESNGIDTLPGPLLNLRTLAIEGDMAGHAASLWIPLLRRCHVLESLSIKSLDPSLADSSFLSMTLAEHCPQLRELILDRPLESIRDSDLARLITAPANGWQTLRITYCNNFRDLASAALVNRCLNLEILALEGSGGLKSRDLQKILSTNQKLRRLEALTKGPVAVPNNVVLYARDLVQSPWTCNETLESLKVLITDIPRPDVQKGPGYWPLTGPLHDGTISDGPELQRQVMSQLGRLVKLKQLWLGHDDQDFEGRGPESHGPSAFGVWCYLDTGFQYSCLDFSLIHGLGLLETLQELEDVDIQRMSLAVGEEEVTWMLQSWTKLTKLVGIPHKHSKVIKQLRPLGLIRRNQE